MSGNKQEKNPSEKRKATDELSHKAEKKSKDTSTAEKISGYDLEGELPSNSSMFFDEENFLISLASSSSSSSSSSQSQPSEYQKLLNDVASAIAAGNQQTIREALMLIQDKVLALETLLVTGAFEKMTLLQVALVMENRPALNLLFTGVSVTKQKQLLEKIDLPGSSLLTELKSNLITKKIVDEDDFESFNNPSFSKFGNAGAKNEVKAKAEKEEADADDYFSLSNIDFSELPNNAQLTSFPPQLPPLSTDNNFASGKEEEKESAPIADEGIGRESVFTLAESKLLNAYRSILRDRLLDDTNKILFINNFLDDLELDIAVEMHTMVDSEHSGSQYKPVFEGVWACLSQRINGGVSLPQQQSSSSSSSSSSTSPGYNPFAQFSDSSSTAHSNEIQNSSAFSKKSK